MEGQIKAASWISVLFSIWLIISPFVLAFSGLSTVAMWARDHCGSDRVDPLWDSRPKPRDLARAKLD